MADASKLKRLGAPPPLEEARTDLIPEPVSSASESPRQDSHIPAGPTRPPEPENEDYQRVDGRALRKTGRTIPFSTRVNVNTDRLIRRLAGKHGMLIAEVVERGAQLLEKELESK
jgi:hypothetical protein